jgi:hypothetical protein
MIEEFRVERALCEQGRPLRVTYEQTTPDVLDELRAALLDAVTLRHSAEDIGRTYDSVLRAFNAVTIHFAYLAADHVESGGVRTIGSVRNTPEWERYVHSNWNELVRLLEPIPAAHTDMGSTAMCSTADELADMLHRWLRDVGFDLYDAPEGLYFDVLRHDF